MESVWSEELSVGNASIDSDHKKLIAMVNGVEAMIRIRDSLALRQALELLGHQLSAHFVSEEDIAQAINFPFTKNRLDHQYVLTEFQHMKRELIDKDGIWSDGAAEHYAHFLSNWIIGHILNEDMQMKTMLQTYPYDFKPS